ncbi:MULTISPECIES: hypothetical protein [Paenibacillus]|uniref:hypothetical protein n=1 Tax=Paenibacillus TaxID=44249 RepID=UPI000F6F3201|nr:MULTISPECIES: hypothetical protein [Paenibacillus]AZH27887.1 hypothetical protein EGM68_03465 [Paenibacillus sp. M-152]WPQ57498.1 hypothetical protein SKN87_03295 [Paenibacillus polymyxa]
MFIARWNLEEAGGKCTSQGTRTGFEAGITDESLMHNEIRSRQGHPCRLQWLRAEKWRSYLGRRASTGACRPFLLNLGLYLE